MRPCLLCVNLPPEMGESAPKNSKKNSGIFGADFEIISEPLPLFRNCNDEK